MNRIIDSNYSDNNGGKTDVDYEGHNKKIGSAIEQLVNAKYDNILKITDEEMIDEMLTMFMAVSFFLLSKLVVSSHLKNLH